MKPSEFKEWIDTLRGMLPPHNAVVYKATAIGGFVCLVAANFAPSHEKAWMNVSTAILALGTALGSSPAKSPDKEG